MFLVLLLQRVPAATEGANYSQQQNQAALSVYCKLAHKWWWRPALVARLASGPSWWTWPSVLVLWNCAAWTWSRSEGWKLENVEFSSSESRSPTVSVPAILTSQILGRLNPLELIVAWRRWQWRITSAGVIWKSVESLSPSGGSRAKMFLIVGQRQTATIGNWRKIIDWRSKSGFNQPGSVAWAPHNADDLFPFYDYQSWAVLCRCLYWASAPSRALLTIPQASPPLHHSASEPMYQEALTALVTIGAFPFFAWSRWRWIIYFPVFPIDSELGFVKELVPFQNEDQNWSTWRISGSRRPVAKKLAVSLKPTYPTPITLLPLTTRQHQQSISL